MAEGRSAGALVGRRVLLGVTGGIAAYKSAYLTRLLSEAGAQVQVVMTPAATHFVGAETFAALSRTPVYSDVFDRPDAVLHVKLAREAEVGIVAPATANVLAKLALGLADDLLTSALLEAECPLVLVPAMHAGMWNNAATQRNIRELIGRGAIVVGPGEGPLAAGDEGIGRMAEPEDVLSATAAVMARDLAGARVLVTAGPTHEPLDAVRYIGNRSSGKMGFAIAAEASRRGADVALVTGPVALPDPRSVETVRVETAQQLREEVLLRFDRADAVVMAAAVADFTPRQISGGKYKKSEGAPPIVLEPTPDILAELGKLKEKQLLVGFAAETDDVEVEARRKLAEKNLDLVVANKVGEPGTGFGAETNTAAILAQGQPDEGLRAWTKAELAAAICDRLARMLSSLGG